MQCTFNNILKIQSSQFVLERNKDRKILGSIGTKISKLNDLSDFGPILILPPFGVFYNYVMDVIRISREF